MGIFWGNLLSESTILELENEEEFDGELYEKKPR